MSTVAYESQPSQVQHVMAAIKWRERQKIFSIALLLLIGVPMTFFGPIAMASIYWLIAAVWGFVWPWQSALAAGCVVLIPLLFRTEWKMQGNYFSDAVTSVFDNYDSSVPSTGFADADTLACLIQNPASVRELGIGLTEYSLGAAADFGSSRHFSSRSIARPSRSPTRCGVDCVPSKCRSRKALRHSTGWRFLSASCDDVRLRKLVRMDFHRGEWRKNLVDLRCAGEA